VEIVFPLTKPAKRSSILGMGYRWSFDTVFTVVWKSPQIQMVFLSGLRTATMGAAQSECSTGSLAYMWDKLEYC